MNLVVIHRSRYLKAPFLNLPVSSNQEQSESFGQFLVLILKKKNFIRPRNITKVKSPKETINRLVMDSLRKPIENWPMAPKIKEAKAYFNQECSEEGGAGVLLLRRGAET